MIRIVDGIPYLIPMSLPPARFGVVGSSLSVGKIRIVQVNGNDGSLENNREGKSLKCFFSKRSPQKGQCIYYRIQVFRADSFYVFLHGNDCVRTHTILIGLFDCKIEAKFHACNKFLSHCIYLFF